MILFDLHPTEDEPAYQRLMLSNLNRQYDFLRSMVNASIATNRLYLSTAVIKAFNFHAIACLHSDAGNFRTYGVTVGEFIPPDWLHVQALMDDFVNQTD